MSRDRNIHHSGEQAILLNNSCAQKIAEAWFFYFWTYGPIHTLFPMTALLVFDDSFHVSSLGYFSAIRTNMPASPTLTFRSFVAPYFLGQAMFNSNNSSDKRWTMYCNSIISFFIQFSLLQGSHICQQNPSIIVIFYPA